MLVFTKADQDDIPVIYDLYRKKVLRYEDPTVADPQEASAALLDALNGRLSLIEKVTVDSCTAAYCSLKNEIDGTVLLCDLLVLPEYRKKGIGSEVLAYCMKKADGMVYRYVYTKDQTERSFYENRGFRIVRMASPTRCVLACTPSRKGRSR